MMHANNTYNFIKQKMYEFSVYTVLLAIGRKLHMKNKIHIHQKRRFWTKKNLITRVINSAKKYPTNVREEKYAEYYFFPLFYIFCRLSVLCLVTSPVTKKHVKLHCSFKKMETDNSVKIFFVCGSVSLHQKIWFKLQFARM